MDGELVGLLVQVILMPVLFALYIYVCVRDVK